MVRPQAITRHEQQKRSCVEDERQPYEECGEGHEPCENWLHDSVCEEGDECADDSRGHVLGGREGNSDRR